MLWIRVNWNCAKRGFPVVQTRLKIHTFLSQIGMLYKWIDGHCKWKSQSNVQAVAMIWLCQSRCIAKILYAKSRIDKIPYAKIPTDKIPYAENALCRNSNCPNALQPVIVVLGLIKSTFFVSFFKMFFCQILLTAILQNCSHCCLSNVSLNSTSRVWKFYMRAFNWGCLFVFNWRDTLVGLWKEARSIANMPLLEI